MMPLIFRLPSGRQDLVVRGKVSGHEQAIREMRQGGDRAILGKGKRSQSTVEPRVSLTLALYAVAQRSILTETQTRFQLIALFVLVLGVELLVMPLMGRRPSVRSLVLNTIVAASGMILAKWAIEGINWTSAQRKLARVLAGL